MNRRDVEKLLGGYAAGTLTEAERRELFEAALRDQTLFSALADEEALRDALADPVSRARILAALEKEPRPARSWQRGPGVWALAGSLAAACLAVVVLVQSRRPAPAARQVAQVTRPAERTAAPVLAEPEKKEMADALAQPKGLARPAARRRVVVPPPPAIAPPAAAPLDASMHAPRRDEEHGLASSPPGTGSGIGASRSPQGIQPAELRPATPAARLAQAPAPAGVVGGVPGGVVGGIAPAPPAPPATLMKAPPPPPQPPPNKLSAVSEAVTVQAEASTDPRDLFYGAGRLRMAPAFGAAASARAKRESKPADRSPVSALGLRCALLQAGPEGAFEVPMNTRLGPGERAGLRIEANERAWVYVVSEGRLLFSGPVEAHRPYLVEPRPGTLYVILSRRQDRGDPATLVQRSRAAGADRGLHFSSGDAALYSATEDPSPDARVMVQIRLNH